MEYTVWYRRWVQSVSCVLLHVPERLFCSCNIHRTKFSPLAVFGTSPCAPPSPSQFTVHCVPHFVNYRVVQTFDRMVRQLRAPLPITFLPSGLHRIHPYFIGAHYVLRSTFFAKLLRSASVSLSERSQKEKEKRKEKIKREPRSAAEVASSSLTTQKKSSPTPSQEIAQSS